MTNTHAPLPTYDHVSSLLRLDASTGQLFWRVNRKSVKAGMRAGSPAGKGYRRVKICNHLYLEHRIAYLLAFGEDPGPKEVDHIDGIPANNAPSNLRLASRGQNQSNGRAYKSGSSGYRGVSWHPQHRKWYALIQVNKKRRDLGLFKCPREAALAYDAAARELFGDYARPNFLENGERNV